MRPFRLASLTCCARKALVSVGDSLACVFLSLGDILVSARTTSVVLHLPQGIVVASLSCSSEWRSVCRLFRRRSLQACWSVPGAQVLGRCQQLCPCEPGRPASRAPHCVLPALSQAAQLFY